MIDRRMFMTGLAAALAPAPAALGATSAADSPLMKVVRAPDCGCCGAWIDHLRAAGFAVDVTMSDDVAAFKEQHGVPQALWSCHTALVQGYLIEGHVPARDILRLLDERPDAVALTVPGMPWGAPGMGPEAERDAYDVILIRRDGGTEVFARYPAA